MSTSSRGDPLKWRAWLYSLATAAIKASADAILLSIVAPEISLLVIGKAVGIGALTSIAHILRESPLPRAEWTEAKRVETIGKE